MPKQTFFNLPDDKRQAILDVAIDAFAEKDYAEVSISQLVARAGIAKGSFYQYFEDKQDLYLYLLELTGIEKATFLQTHPMPDPQMGIFNYMRWLFELGVSFESINPKLARIGYRAYYEQNPRLNEAMAEMRSQSRDFFPNLLRQGIANGELREDLDVDSAAFLFNMLVRELGGHIMQRLGISPEELGREGTLSFDREDAKRIYDAFLRILEQGMGSASAESPSETP